MLKELPKRKKIRLQGYDYSQAGCYFITICTYERQNILCDTVVGQGLCSCRLSQAGDIARTELYKLETRYKNIKIDKNVIMPNHIHAIIIIERREQSPRPTTITDIICAYKSMTTKSYNETLHTSGKTIWQPRFHDRVIRNEEEYKRIWQYIDENPAKWADDCYFTKNKDF